MVALSLKKFNEDIKNSYFPNEGNESFNLAFLKIVSDGSNQGLTGCQFDPYDCDENYNSFNQSDVDKITIQNNTAGLS